MSRRPVPPWPVVVLATIAVLFFALPFAGLLWRAPWGRVIDVLGEPEVRTALWLSVRTSLTAAGLSVVLGVPLAWVLASVGFPGRGAVRALCTLSMVLPPVVGGVALFAALGRRGIAGQYLYDWFGIRLPFSTAGVEAALRQHDTRVDDAARTLGGSRWYVFRRVTVPAVRPALIAGVVLAWARAIGEFGATITFAGNFPGTTRTMPLATYLALETDPDEALVLSLTLVAVSFAVLVGLRDRWLGGEAAVA
jgi:molybdate transport system permease protein